ncbi:MAG: class I SAM-dependent methyltransferase [Nitrospirota bacterium]
MKCSKCNSLVSQRLQTDNFNNETNDFHTLYDKDYWFSYQEKELKLPNILSRARTDLTDRCIYWLDTFLKYKLPPAKTLELGSAHGGFVAMLNWANFDATGLEISPWVVDFSSKTFSVPILLGVVEEQDIKPESLDAIILMDVFEHLADPARTMRHCLSLLKQNGILLIQMPCLPENISYEQMVENNDTFLSILKDVGHLYLFSKKSIREFFYRIGAKYLEFEPPIFSHYDMFFVVSREPLEVNAIEEIEKSLSETPSGRLVQALLDIYKQRNVLREKYEGTEANRAAGLEVINRVSNELSTKEAAIKQLHKTLLQSECNLKIKCDELETIRSSFIWRIIKSFRWIYNRFIPGSNTQ